MYEPHPTFKPPKDLNIKIWRYMDFTKFISLIDSRRLFFTRSDNFDDPFEASWPKINIDASKIPPTELSKKEQQLYIRSTSKIGKITKDWQKHVALNCWHENNYESAAMWKLYLKSDEGIAIQSTFSLLKKSIIDEEKVYIGKVKYIDYETEFIKANNILEPFVHKRKSYEHEREIRAVVIILPDIAAFEISKETIRDGVSIKIDIETLVQKIYIAPNSPQWFADLVKGVINRYGYSFEIIHSQINSAPFA